MRCLYNFRGTCVPFGCLVRVFCDRPVSAYLSLITKWNILRLFTFILSLLKALRTDNSCWKIVCATNLSLPKFLSPQPPFPELSPTPNPPFIHIYRHGVHLNLCALNCKECVLSANFNVAHEVRHSGLSDSLLDGSVFVKTSSISHVFQLFLSSCNLILTPTFTLQLQKRKINSFRLIVLASGVKK